MAGLCDLPEEVLEEIMSRLSPESLRRLKCVSKSWYDFIKALINNPVFVTKHLETMKKKMASSRPCHLSKLMAIGSPEEDWKEGGVEPANCLLRLANDDSDDSVYVPCVTDDLKRLTLDATVLRAFRFMGHCNGIICLAQYFRKNIILLLNPALREIKTLPCSCLGNKFRIWAIGFGYDSRANDYKVVATGFHLRGPAYPSKAEVYTLTTDSWKEINLNGHITNRIYGKAEYCNGVCYWYNCDVKYTITSFDFGDDVFRTTMLPNNVLREAQNWDDLGGDAELGVCNESLVLLFYRRSALNVIDMWVMNSNSWTKHLTIGPLQGIQDPLAFWGNDILYMRTESDKIISYNLSAQELGDHTVDSEWFRRDSLVVYVKSLVSVLKKSQRNSAVEMTHPSSGSSCP